MKRISNATLARLPGSVCRPGYDRTRLRPRIVHLGLGNFHRAHQAWYTDAALADAVRPDWGICGVSLRSPAVRDRLQPQDGLYTLEVRHNADTSRRVIGSVIETLVAPEQPGLLLQRMAGADVISLTVTEKAYCLDGGGELDLAHPDIVHDLGASGMPRSVIGWLAKVLADRRRAAGAPVNIICCDNLSDNGHRLRAALQQFLAVADQGTGAWLDANAAFPCTMVDRIVPATTAEVIDSVSAALGLQDQAPVITEPFSQWVIEDRFVAEVPGWSDHGALLVDDVQAFETAKLRMLNGSHSTLAYLGCLADLETVADALTDPRYHALLERLMRSEVQPGLKPPTGLDLDDYRGELLGRFANTATRHRLRQIAMDGSQKLPPRLLGSVRDALQRGGSLHCLSLSVAAWIRYLRGSTLSGEHFEVDDPLAEPLAACLGETRGDAAAFMRASGLFGEDLPAQAPFTSKVQAWLDALDRDGIDAVLQRAIS
jgi:fructuronate reductase